MTLSNYCSRDILRNPRALQLTAEKWPTHFGAMNVVRSLAEPTSDTATVLLHGVGGSWVAWTPLLQELLDQGCGLENVVLVDLPGFGDSENTQNHLEARVVGEQLVRLVKGLGFSRLRAVGHSMGGFLALDLASQGHPEVEAVGSVSGAYYSVVDTVQRPLRALGIHRTAAATYLSLCLLAKLGAAVTPLTRTAQSMGLLSRALRPVVARPQQLRPSVLAYLSENVNLKSFALAARNGDGYDCSARWSQIRVPVLAAFGACDQLVPPSNLTRLERDVSCLGAALFEGMGHFGPLERPEVIAAFLRPLFEQERVTLRGAPAETGRTGVLVESRSEPSIALE